MEQPTMHPISSGLYQLKGDYTAEFSVAGALRRVVVPDGFVSDGASVPRILWPLIRPDGPQRAAALVHDFIYRTAGDLPEGSTFVDNNGEWFQCLDDFTRREADAILRTLMRKAGLSRRLALVAWIGVRIGGWITWNKSKRERGA